MEHVGRHQLVARCACLSFCPLFSSIGPIHLRRAPPRRRCDIDLEAWSTLCRHPALPNRTRPRRVRESQERRGSAATPRPSDALHLLVGGTVYCTGRRKGVASPCVRRVAERPASGTVPSAKLSFARVPRPGSVRSPVLVADTAPCAPTTRHRAPPPPLTPELSRPRRALVEAPVHPLVRTVTCGRFGAHVVVQ
ncbi:hypothetical protein C8R47DRAFT_1170692 [Mycena vitilis]|nr:hypothetical protein C8R47DRAFT_1170692 [Mycena vitilis]